MSSEFNPPSAEVDRVFSTFATTPAKQRMWCADAWSIILALRQHVSLDQSEHDTIFACAAVDFTMTKIGFTGRWLPQVAAALHMKAEDLFTIINDCKAAPRRRNPKRQNDRDSSATSTLTERVSGSPVLVEFFVAVRKSRQQNPMCVLLKSQGADSYEPMCCDDLQLSIAHDVDEWCLHTCKLHVDPSDSFTVTYRALDPHARRRWQPVAVPYSLVIDESASPAEFYSAVAGCVKRIVSRIHSLQYIGSSLSNLANSLRRTKCLPHSPDCSTLGQRLWAVTVPNFDWAETFIAHVMCTCFAVGVFQPRFEPDVTLLPDLSQHGDPCAALEHFFQVLSATDVVDEVTRMISFNIQEELLPGEWVPDKWTENARQWGVFLLVGVQDWSEAKAEFLPFVWLKWLTFLPFLEKNMAPDRLRQLCTLQSCDVFLHHSSIFRFLWRRFQLPGNSRGMYDIWTCLDSVPTEVQLADLVDQWYGIVKTFCDATVTVSTLADLFVQPRRKLPTLTSREEACRVAQRSLVKVEEAFKERFHLERAGMWYVPLDCLPKRLDRSAFYTFAIRAVRAKSMHAELSALGEVARKLGAPFPAGHPITALAALLQNDAPIGDVARAFDAALQAEGGLIGKLPVGFLTAVDAAIDNGLPRLCQDFPNHDVVQSIVDDRRPRCPADLREALDDFLEAHSALSQGSPVISSGFEHWKKRKFPSNAALVHYLIEINWVGRLLTNIRDMQAIESALGGVITTDVGELLQWLDEANTTLYGPNGWATPRDDPAAEAEQLIQQLADARGVLTTLIATQVAASADVATRRAECCAAATTLAQFLPSLELTLTDAPPQPTPCCVNGFDACGPRPPPALVQALVDAVAAAETAHGDAIDAIAPAASSSNGPVARVAATYVENLKVAMQAAHAALTGSAALSAEECGHHRAIAESVLEKEGPWAGDVGLQRRDDAISSLDVLTARRKAARQVVKRAERAVAQAELNLHSDLDDDDAMEAATTALQTAKAQLSAALPELHTATAAVQHWATTGEGALALQAFPGDAVLTSALSGLFEADFNAETALSRTPKVDMAVEYPAGLTEASAVCVYFAQRVASDPDATDTPVVLRRLRLSSPEHVDEAKRQLRDAGRIAIGLQACPDTAAGCPPVVKATRWFVAKGPGGGVADAWLEFPRAGFGTLAEALGRGSGVFSTAAAIGLCQRLVRAVAQLHAAGIRHGDLNPSNVVLWDDPRSTVVRPGIIDLLDTVSVGATRTLRGATMEWLPPEAVAAMTAGEKVLGTQQLDLWQLGRICQAVLSASADSAQLGSTVCEAASTLCVADPSARRSAADVLFDIEHAVAGAASSTTWALPPGSWLCQRGAAPGVDFVSLDLTTDPAAVALEACAVSVGRRVRAVYRLENVQLWHVYAAERARVGEQAQGAPLPPQLQTEVSLSFAAAPNGARQALVGSQSHTEVLLFHGAPRNTHRLIAEGGLDPSYSGERVGSLFGAATCLTPLWAKAANEYAPGGGAGVFVTRVAVGRVADCLTTPTTVTSRYRRPPDGHHSVVGSNGRPGVVAAVYRPSRMYPEYLVVFDD